MTVATEMAELEGAIGEAELSDEEAELARGLVGEGMPIAEAIAATLAERGDGANEPPAEGAAGAELGEPGGKQLRDLEKETDRHLERVHAIMGAHVADFDACDACGGIGLTPPGPRPQEHEYFRACSTCAGFGQVKTGSLRQGQEARDCPLCKGRGYLEALDGQGQPLADRAASVPIPQAPSPAPVVELAPPATNGEQTAPTFGTPAWMGDPSLSR
jgi:hypothetical protein